MEQLNLLIIAAKNLLLRNWLKYLAMRLLQKSSWFQKEIIPDIKNWPPLTPILEINERDYTAQDIDQANIIIIAVKKNDIVHQTKSQIRPKRKISFTTCIIPNSVIFYLSS